MIGRTLAHYKILSKLGAGGMGEVYEAEDLTLERKVALKVLTAETARDPSRLERFQREARALAALDHPNIVTVFSVEEAGGIHFLTMGLVPGRTLDRLVPASGLPLDRFFAIALPLVEALAAAHDRHVIHRDLKPGNVMVTAEGRVKVLDFGLAKLAEPEPGRPDDRTRAQALTGTGTVVGTMPYMSPEQIEGKPLDARSDLFSLGVVLYEMLVGHRPFSGGTSPALMSSIMKDSPRSPVEIRRDLPPELGSIILSCLEKDPGRRPQTARELHVRLQESRSASREGAPNPWPVEGGNIGSQGTPEVPAIAVLPFTDMSSEGDQEYFCDGMAEEIINSLARVKGLRVASRISAFGFKKSNADIRTIGARLGVAKILEGSVRKAEDRLRITVQLIDVADDSHLWSERYDRKLEDVFAIQEDIAQSIVQALKVSLTPGENRALREAPTNQVDAYDCYLRGREFFYRGSRRDHEFACQMFTRAIEIDPSFTRAYAGLADGKAYIYKHFSRDPAILAEADAASAKALELAPNLAEAHASRGVVHWLLGRGDEADQAFATAISLDPKLFEAYFLFGISCYNRGKLEAAARLFQKAAVVRPEDYQAPLILAGVHRGLGRVEEAKNAYRQGLSVAERHLELHPDDARAWYLGAGALVALGEIERGLTWAQKSLAMDRENPLLFYNLAGIYASAGLIDEGVDYMARAVELGYGHGEGLRNDPDLAPLRDHPRYKALIERLTGPAS